jgi:hypothetical protein
MWFEQGNFGRAGRLLTWCGDVRDVFSLRRGGDRRSGAIAGVLRMWLILLVATIGIIALGTRRRKRSRTLPAAFTSFWFLLFILAAKTIAEFRSTSASPGVDGRLVLGLTESPVCLPRSVTQHLVPLLANATQRRRVFFFLPILIRVTGETGLLSARLLSVPMLC